MRSFAGVYFLLRFLPFIYYPCQLSRTPFSFGSYLVVIFLSATLLIAIARPYKETYMNVYDTLLLGQLTLMSKLHTDDYYEGMGTQIFIINLIPVIALVACFIYVKVFKAYGFRCCQKGAHVRDEREEDFMSSVLENNGRDGSETQPLLTSTTSSSVKNYSDEY